ncbi:helix-turn-helix domain-containing protein [Haladaptatus halobius]|uniref:helix-turn-helix domain-containing protein n=1 Tax=Haladaptatus halobius TaxID=2884875 RepID=UPI001D09FFFE|nr:helix-turn-helix domain-containing protein [Haladaptatus halobius]
MNPDLSAEFRLSSSSLALIGLAASIPNARIKLDEVVGVDHSVLLCWVEAESYDTVEAALDAEASIAAWTLLEGATERRLYRLRMAESTEVQVAIPEEFIKRGTTPIHATITEDGWLMRARFPDRTTLTEYRDACHQRGMSFTLEGLYQPTTDSEGEGLSLAGLTPKQREALLLAYEEGYYDLPRGTDLTDLSDRLGISRRSLSDRLRRAEREIIATAITNERLTPKDASFTQPDNIE